MQNSCYWNCYSWNRSPILLIDVRMLHQLRYAPPRRMLACWDTLMPH
uniref:Uncharacterized protein n=1 Tax=Picea glauca TaxID=3330 RepID=A0A117NIC0_PICGL|nr:hypothetical protein ABT39_MTgene2883 [Picea glauca]QHR87589.1 hypothetical protein Q903MT_gene1600 [Picea sitchensis]